MQMEGLKRDMLAKIAETKAACEAAIEAKAIELAEGLEAADRCPCAPAASPAWYGTFDHIFSGSAVYWYSTWPGGASLPRETD